MDYKNQTSISGNFIILSANETHILLSLDQVGQAKYFDASVNWKADRENNGFFYSDMYPNKKFLALNDELKPITDKLTDRFMMLPFLGTDDSVLWCWKTAKLLNNHTFKLNNIPNFLMEKNSPIHSYAYFEDKIIYPCNVNDLVAYALNSGVV